MTDQLDTDIRDVLARIVDDAPAPHDLDAYVARRNPADHESSRPNRWIVGGSIGLAAAAAGVAFILLPDDTADTVISPVTEAPVPDVSAPDTSTPDFTRNDPDAEVTEPAPSDPTVGSTVPVDAPPPSDVDLVDTLISVSDRGVEISQGDAFRTVVNGPVASAAGLPDGRLVVATHALARFGEVFVIDSDGTTTQFWPAGLPTDRQTQIHLLDATRVGGVDNVLMSIFTGPCQTGFDQCDIEIATAPLSDDSDSGLFIIDGGENAFEYFVVAELVDGPEGPFVVGRDTVSASTGPYIRDGLDGVAPFDVATLGLGADYPESNLEFSTDDGYVGWVLDRFVSTDVDEVVIHDYLADGSDNPENIVIPTGDVTSRFGQIVDVNLALDRSDDGAIGGSIWLSTVPFAGAGNEAGQFVNIDLDGNVIGQLASVGDSAMLSDLTSMPDGLSFGSNVVNLPTVDNSDGTGVSPQQVREFVGLPDGVTGIVASGFTGVRYIDDDGAVQTISGEPARSAAWLGDDIIFEDSDAVVEELQPLLWSASTGEVTPLDLPGDGDGGVLIELWDARIIDGARYVLYSTRQPQCAGFEGCEGVLRVHDIDGGDTFEIARQSLWESAWSGLKLTSNRWVVGGQSDEAISGPFLAAFGDTPAPTPGDLGLEDGYADCTECPTGFTASDDGSTFAWLEFPAGQASGDLVVRSLDPTVPAVRNSIGLDASGAGTCKLTASDLNIDEGVGTVSGTIRAEECGEVQNLSYWVDPATGSFTALEYDRYYDLK